MEFDAWVTLGVVGLTIVALAREVLPPSAIILAATVVLLVLGIINPQQAFSGFSNPAPITVASLYVLARAVEKTGALQPIVRLTMGEGASRRWRLSRLLLPSATASAFLNNTPIVAMLVPQISEWADRRGLSPSRYLMPLSFAAIFGGMVTAIGTSTNLVVSGLLVEHGAPPMGMFEISSIGLPIAIGGVALLIVLSPTLLPERRPARQLEDGVREFSVSMEVEPSGPLDGVAVEAGGLRHLQGVYLVEIERNDQTIAPVSPETKLQGGDRLMFVGRADLVVDLHGTRGLISTERRHIREFDATRHAFFEAVVGPASPLVGRTLLESRFRGRYQGAVVAIHRAGERLRAKLGAVRLKLGDTLLVLADPAFRDRWRDRNDFLLVSRLGGSMPIPTRKAWLVGLIAVGIVGGAAMGVYPILHLSLLGALAIPIFGILTPSEARDAVDLDVIVVIAAAFGMGAAIESSGLADALAGGLTGVFGGFGDTGALFGVLLATVILKTVVTNNATAVLMFPIAMSTARQLGVDERGMALALAVMCSASFLTPFAYQTNLMVYGPGGYRFGDYARLGLPLTVFVMIGLLIIGLPG